MVNRVFDGRAAKLAFERCISVAVIPECTRSDTAQRHNAARCHCGATGVALGCYCSDSRAPRFAALACAGLTCCHRM